MQTSCVSHPSSEPLIIVREWQIEFCKELGNTAQTGAALLSFFEHWHNVKLQIRRKNRAANEVRMKHGDKAIYSETLLQRHTQKEIEKGIMGIGKKNSIIKAKQFLIEKGVITQGSNPNPRYSFDKAGFYMFYPSVVQEWINERERLKIKPKLEMPDGHKEGKPKEVTPKVPKKSNRTPQTDAVVNYLNERLELTGNRVYQKTSKATIALIVALLKKGYEVDNFKEVIDYKYNDWKGTTWYQYMRPSTLFAPNKFEGYLAAANSKRTNSKTSKKTVNVTAETMNNWAAGL